VQRTELITAATFLLRLQQRSSLRSTWKGLWL